MIPPVSARNFKTPEVGGLSSSSFQWKSNTWYSTDNDAFYVGETLLCSELSGSVYKIIVPEITKIDKGQNQKKLLFPKYTNVNNLYAFAHSIYGQTESNIIGTEAPVLTYNPRTDIYNFSFFGLYEPEVQSKVLFNYSLKIRDTDIVPVDIRAITPDFIVFNTTPTEGIESSLIQISSYSKNYLAWYSCTAIPPLFDITYTVTSSQYIFNTIPNNQYPFKYNGTFFNYVCAINPSYDTTVYFECAFYRLTGTSEYSNVFVENTSTPGMFTLSTVPANNNPGDGACLYFYNSDEFIPGGVGTGLGYASYQGPLYYTPSGESTNVYQISGMYRGFIGIGFDISGYFGTAISGQSGFLSGGTPMYVRPGSISIRGSSEAPIHHGIIYRGQRLFLEGLRIQQNVSDISEVQYNKFRVRLIDEAKRVYVDALEYNSGEYFNLVNLPLTGNNMMYRGFTATSYRNTTRSHIHRCTT